MATSYNIPRVKAAQATLLNFNNPISSIETAINEISSRVDSIQNKSAVLLFDQPIAVDQQTGSPIQRGSLVYFNSEDTAMRFDRAVARVLSAPGERGQTVASPQAVVCGMLVDSHQAGQSILGTVLVGGMYEASNDVLAGCFGTTTPSAGLYYLSPTHPGQVTKNPVQLDQKLRQPVLEYMGGSKILLSLFYLAHDSHQHSSYTIPGEGQQTADSPTGSWKAAAVSAGDPSTARFKYKDPQQLFSILGQLSAQITAVFYKGLLQVPGDPDTKVWIQGKNLYSKTQKPPAANSVVLINHFPLAYGAPVVRSVQSQSPLLVANNKRGGVSLTLKNYSKLETQASQFAVASIYDDKIRYTPIISGIQAGPGISLTVGAQGTAVVSSGAVLDTYADASLIDLQGTLRVSDTQKTFIRFPGGRKTGFVMYCTIPYIPTGGVVAYPWVQRCGGSGQLTVQSKFIGLGTTNAPVSAQQMPPLTIALPGASDTSYYIEKTTSPLNITGAGCLVVSINSIDQVADIDLFRQGVYLQAAVPQTPAQQEDTSSISNAVVIDTFMAGQQIPSFCVVRIVDNTVRKCNAAEADSYDTAVGISKGTFNSSQQVQYVAAGVFTSQGLSFTPGVPVYVGADGALTQSVQDTAALAYIQRIGIALSANTVQVTIGTAILTGQVTA